MIAPVTAASAAAPSAAGFAQSATGSPIRFANRSDPLVGPLTAAAAPHSRDVLHFAPASGAVMPRQVNTSFNHAGLQKEVLGFAPYWELSQESSWDYNVLSTVVYFGLTLNWDGTWTTGTGGWQGFYSQELVDMINRAHAAGDRVLLSVEASGEAPLNDVVTYPPITQTALANIVGAISVRGVDGVNIDFEGYTSPGYPNIQTGLTDFMTQLSSQVHAKWAQDLVTIDTYTGSASWDFGLMKIDALAPVVDAMFIMAYDMSFSNMPGQAGPNAPMTGWTYNVTTSIRQYLTKAPASK